MPVTFRLGPFVFGSARLSAASRVYGCPPALPINPACQRGPFLHKLLPKCAM